MNIPRWFAYTLKGFGSLILLFVLAAVLFPVFAKTRCKCAQGGCSVNEKQIGLALMQYVQDNDGFLPNISETPAGTATWRTAILPYIKSRQVYQCPDRDHAAKMLGPDGFPRSYTANYSGNYSGGALDQGQGLFAGPGSRHIAFADVMEPASLIAVCEAEGSNAPKFNIDDMTRFGPDKHIFWAGHHNLSNFLFADGHVKSIPPTQTARYAAFKGTDGSLERYIWYRDGRKPLSAAGVAILAEAEKRGASRP